MARDIMKINAFQIRDLGAFDHAPVADESDPLAAEALGDLLHLSAKGLGVGRVAVKHFD